MRKNWFGGKLHEATWNLWGGTALGGVACAIVGGLIDFVRFDMLKESALDGFAVRCWIYGGLLGGVVTGMAFFAYGCRRSAMSRCLTNHNPLADRG